VPASLAAGKTSPSGFDQRHGEGDLVAPGGFPDFQLAGGAVDQQQALADVVLGEALPLETAVASAGRPGIGDGEAQAAGLPGDADAQLSAFGQALNAVMDGVLDQRLQQQRRHGRGERQIGGQSPVHLEPVAHAQVFDGQIAAGQLQLVAQG
ncbi:hypothetical protein RZS08_15160, partial [Arthrospira platensis SPKY1]|nr:hypothetical protein [Arthrospira platensis SPKY1]